MLHGHTEDVANQLAHDAKLLHTNLMESFETYILNATGASSVHAIEQKTGIARATLSRKLKGRPAVETVVAICRAYNVSFLEAFVAAGFIREDEAKSISGESSIRTATDRQLAEEILRRVIETESSELTKPLDIGADGYPDYSNLSEADAKSYDLAAKKEDEHIGYDDLPNEP